MFDTRIPDSSSDEEESSGIYKKKHESTMSLNTNNNVVYNIRYSIKYLDMQSLL